MLSATTLLVLITKDKNLWVEETVKRRGAEANSENVNVSPFFSGGGIFLLSWKFLSLFSLAAFSFFLQFFLRQNVIDFQKNTILKMSMSVLFYKEVAFSFLSGFS